MSAPPSPAAGGQPASTATRRKSGRVSKKPDRFAPDAHSTSTTKRKRGTDNDSGVEASETSDPESDPTSDDEPDEEEIRERRRKRKTKGTARKPAAKKPKTNGDSVSLAIRPAANATRKIAKRPRKAPVRKSTLADDTEGLYGTSCQPAWHQHPPANTRQPTCSPVATDWKT